MESDTINTLQAENIKQMVKTVASCENKHPNRIHNELKKQFGYHSYKNIPPSIYEQIKTILNNRLCPGH